MNDKSELPYVLIKGKLVDVKMWTKYVPVESGAIDQLRSITKLPFVFKHVAAMPDVHIGIGSTVGTVMATKKAVIPAAVGVDIGCFTGTTLVQLTDGRQLSFLDLIDEFENGIQNYTYSINAENNIQISKISNIMETRKVDKLARIYLDNGRVIDCTVDHKFMLRSGQYKEAQFLDINESLMPYYEDFSELSDKSMINDNKDNKVLENYHIVYNPGINLWEYSHRLSDSYNFRNNFHRKPAEDKWARHHIDFNKFNNNPDNILRVGFKEHWEIHANAISENNKRGLTGWGKAWKLHKDGWAARSSAVMTKLHTDPVFKINHAARALARINDLNDDPTDNMTAHREKIAKLGGKRFTEKNKDCNTNLFRQITKIRNSVKFLTNLGVDVYDEEVWNRARDTTVVYNFPKWSTAKSTCTKVGVKLLDTADDIIYEELRAKLSYKKLFDNHKVEKIEIINLGNEIPVYCLTVPEFGNFALAAGVFVKNCGMIACRTSLKATDLPDNLHKLRMEIEHMVPVGMDEHGISRLNQTGHQHTRTVLNNQWRQLDKDLDVITTKHLVIEKMVKNSAEKAYRQLGSLGGGNHFVELCVCENQDVWIMLHSGSRGIGNAIGRYFIELAQKEMESQQVKLPNKDLSYLEEGSVYYQDYIDAVSWAQEYAKRNRDAMLELVITAMTRHLPVFKITKEAINCHHNYISEENHFGESVIITRKGAVSAQRGELGIIPGSMGAKSFIVRGLGNTESFCSCSHGAGRVMSRSAAKKLISVAEHVEATKGVECRKDEGMIDESPAAYKSIDDVMLSQSDLVEIVHTLKQILCVKG